MSTGNSLIPRLRLWKTIYGGRTDSMGAAGAHLSEERLYEMATSGGIEHSEAYSVHHVSLCPLCLEKWAAFRKAVYQIEHMESRAYPTMAHGRREAAADRGAKRSESLLSNCGAFRLNLLPRMDDSEKGMVTLELVKDHAKTLEGRFVTVRDRNGVVLLSGMPRQGRLAQPCERLSDFDVSIWTVIGNEQGDNNRITTE